MLGREARSVACRSYVLQWSDRIAEVGPWMLSWRELRLLTRISRLTAKWKNRSLPRVPRLAAQHRWTESGASLPESAENGGVWRTPANSTWTTKKKLAHVTPKKKL